MKMIILMGMKLKKVVVIGEVHFIFQAQEKQQAKPNTGKLNPVGAGNLFVRMENQQSMQLN